MIWSKSPTAGCLVTALLLGSAPVAAADGAARRLALIAGVNDGGTERPMLRYAESDAVAFAEVMEELGGLARRDRLLLIGPSAGEIQDGMQRLGRMAAAAKGPGTRLEVLLYYSGHSDEEGLLIRGERIGYKELRTFLDSLGAEVRIAVLDSCSSGAMTRSKGGKPRPPFLVDAANAVKGHAFLTSSSATEAAQESDRIGASFFTHYLVSGLRGAADASGDKRVTLTEAYHFAFHETLARTETTASGPQHPTYDINMVGSGDLVLTDLSSADSGVSLAEEVEGRLFVRDKAGRLVAEVNKARGRRVELGLEPGAYEVTLLTGSVALRGELNVARDRPAELTGLELAPAHLELAMARGSVDPAALDLEATTETYRKIPFAWSLVPPIGTPIEGKTSKRFSLNLVLGVSDRVDGVEIGNINVVHGGVRGVQVGGVANVNRGGLNGFMVAPFNLLGGGGRGTQISGSAGIIRGDFAGVQGAGGVSFIKGRGDRLLQVSGGAGIVTSSLLGLQVAGGASLVGGGARGGQVGGGLVFAGEGIHGVQAAGGAAIAGGEARGIQVSGALNIAGGLMHGVQASGAVNFARQAEGAQIAVLNVSGALSGAQVGVVNIAAGPVRGAQVGVLNISGDYERGTPVGLLSFVKNGQHHVDVWASEASLFNVGLKLGGQYVYSLVAVGYRPEARDGYDALSFGAGIGATLPLTGALFVAVDALGHNVFLGEAGEVGESRTIVLQRRNPDLLCQLRLMAGYKLFEHLGLFAGISGNAYLTFEEDRHAAYPIGPMRTRIQDHEVTARLWPGVFGGVQL